MKENWRDVVGYEGLYEVSNLGRVRSHYGREIKYLNGTKNKIGYIQVGLCKNGKMKSFLVHRLVYTAFNSPIPDGMQIDHANTVRDDNRLSNLRCVTPSENHRNPITAKRVQEANRRLAENPQWRHRQREGVRRARAKAVLQLDKDTGEVIRQWESMMDVERELGISIGNISQCCNGKQKTAGGYRWEFA